MQNSKKRKQRGATMVEYALIVAAIALVAWVGAKALGLSVNAKFQSIANSISS